MEVTGHKLVAVLNALRGFTWANAPGAQKLMQQMALELKEYEHTVLIRFEGQQLSLVQASNLLEELGKKAQENQFDPILSYRRFTLQGQIHEGYGVKIGSDLTEDELSFHGKLVDIINGVQP